MHTLEEWLVITGWITAEELAAFSGESESTISRRLNGREARKTRPKVIGWIDDGLVCSRRVGRTLPPSERLLASSKLLGQVYPQSHTHPVPGDFHKRQDHDPLFSELAHQHPTYFNGKAGSLFNFGRVEMLEIFYPLAPVLFEGEGAAWSPTGRPLKLLSWRWVKNTRFIKALTTYEGNVRVGFCYVGLEVTAETLRWHSENRFAREKERLLVTQSSGLLLEIERYRNHMYNHYAEPPEPGLDFDSHLSGLVICSPDLGAIKIAMEVLPRYNFLRENAYMYAVGPAGAKDSLRLYTGVTTPVDDDVADAFEDIIVDFPEELCPSPKKAATKNIMADKTGVSELPLAMSRVEILQGVLITRIFNIIMQWSGFTYQNLMRMLKGSSLRVKGCLNDLVNSDLLISIPVWELRDGELVSHEPVWRDGKLVPPEPPEPNEENPIVRTFDMYYGSDTAAIYVEHRDTVSLKRIRDRIHEDIRGDHNEDRPKLRHTLQLNDCIVALTRGGFKPFAGYRGCVYIPGGGQLVPDAWMPVKVEIGPITLEGAGEPVYVDLKLLIEYERSATTPEEVRRKLRAYIRAAIAGFPTPVLFICETEEAMHTFRREHENLQRENRANFRLFTSTYAEVVAGICSGETLTMNGHPVRVSTPTEK